MSCCSILVKNNGIALSREKLLSDVWGFDFYGDDRTVDTHIKMLQQQFERVQKIYRNTQGNGIQIRSMIKGKQRFQQSEFYIVVFFS